MTEAQKSSKNRFEKEADALRKNLEKRRKQREAREAKQQQKDSKNGQD